MIPVSTSFDNRMSLNTRPQIYAEVEFQQVAAGAAAASSFAATGQHANSQITQLANGVTQLPLYARLDYGGWPGDGSRAVMPSSFTGQVGAMSSAPSDATLSLSPMVVAVNLSMLISTVGLSFNFDSALGTYAPSFTVAAYNGASLVDSFTATAAGPVCAVNHPISNYNKIIVTFNSWNAPGTKARLAQIIFGIIKVFNNKTLVDLFAVTRTIDPVNQNVQAGNLKFAFDNRDGAYDFENPSGIYSYMTSQIKVLPRIGFSGELVPMGVYYLTDWSADQTTGKAAMQASSTISMLDITFPDTTYTSATLMTIAAAALTQAGIASYSLDSSLSGITVTVLVKGLTCRQVLTHIATAVCMTLYEDVNGKIIIGALSTTASGFTISYYNSSKPLSTLDEPLKSVIVKYGTTTDGSGNTIDQTVSGSYASAGREISIKDNPFIQTITVANAVLAWFAAYYQRRKLYQNNWRQHPKIEPADIVADQTKYGTPSVQVLSQQFSFSAGGLTGQTISRGM